MPDPVLQGLLKLPPITARPFAPPEMLEPDDPIARLPQGLLETLYGRGDAADPFECVPEPSSPSSQSMEGIRFDALLPHCPAPAQDGEGKARYAALGAPARRGLSRAFNMPARACAHSSLNRPAARCGGPWPRATSRSRTCEVRRRSHRSSP
jgi:hypothetical protein